MRSIDQVRDEVQKANQRVLELAGEGEQRSLAEFKAELWSAMLALGRRLVAMFLAVHVARPRAAEYLHGGRRWKLGNNHQTKLGTRFGKVVFDRPIGRDVMDERAAGDLPVDRELGLGSGFSLGVVVAVTRLCAQMAFSGARQTFKETQVPAQQAAHCARRSPGARHYASR